MPLWFEWEYNPEPEITDSSKDAHAEGRRCAAAQLDQFWFAHRGADLRILTDRGYVVVVRGQSAATGHGQQGMHPKGITELRELTSEEGVSLPVFLVFLDGRGCRIAHSGWVHELVEAHPLFKINKEDPQSRYGWNARAENSAWDQELARTEAIDGEYAIVFPDSVPPARDDLFAGLA